MGLDGQWVKNFLWVWGQAMGNTRPSAPTFCDVPFNRQVTLELIHTHRLLSSHAAVGPYKD